MGRMNDWFWARAMATEGNLTTGQATLDGIACDIADDYVNFNIVPDYSQATKYCNAAGFRYDSLLEEEKDYLDRQVEIFIKSSR